MEIRCQKGDGTKIHKCLAGISKPFLKAGLITFWYTIQTQTWYGEFKDSR